MDGLLGVPHPYMSLLKRRKLSLELIRDHPGLRGLIVPQGNAIRIQNRHKSVLIRDRTTLDLVYFYAGLKAISVGIDAHLPRQFGDVHEDVDPDIRQDVDEAVNYIHKSVSSYWTALKGIHSLNGDSYTEETPESMRYVHLTFIADRLRTSSKVGDWVADRHIRDPDEENASFCSSVFRNMRPDGTGEIPLLRDELTMISPVVSLVCCLLQEIVDGYLTRDSVSVDTMVDMLDIFGCPDVEGDAMHRLRSKIRTFSLSYVVRGVPNSNAEAQDHHICSNHYLIRNFSKHPLLKWAVRIPEIPYRNAVRRVLDLRGWLITGDVVGHAVDLSKS